VNRETPWRLLLGTQIFVALGILGFRWGLAPALMETYRNAGVALPWLTRLALVSGLPIATIAICTIVALGAVFVGSQRGQRLRVLSVALTVSGLVFVLSVVAAVWPFTHS
jgi:hypothetical protein